MDEIPDIASGKASLRVRACNNLQGILERLLQRVWYRFIECFLRVLAECEVLMMFLVSTQSDRICWPNKLKAAVVSTCSFVRRVVRT